MHQKSKRLRLYIGIHFQILGLLFAIHTAIVEIIIDETRVLFDHESHAIASDELDRCVWSDLANVLYFARYLVPRFSMAMNAASLFSYFWSQIYKSSIYRRTSSMEY